MAFEQNPAGGAETLIARYMQEGEELFDAGDYEEALSRWLKVLEIDPANELAMQNMAKAHEKLMGSPFKKVVSKALPDPPAAPPQPKVAPPPEATAPSRSTPPAPRQPSPAPVPSPVPAAALPPKRERDSGKIEREKESDERASIEAHLKRYLKRGVDFFNSKDYDKAIVEWAKVLRERPSHDTTLHYIRKARRRLEKTLSPEKRREDTEAFERLAGHGDEYFREGEHRMAINQYVQALTYRPEDEDLLEKLHKAEGALRQAGETVSTAPGKPRQLRHVESPTSSSQSGAVPRPAPDTEKLAAAAKSIYSQMMKEERGEAPTKRASGRPTGIRTQVSAPSEGSRFVGLKIAIILAGLGFIGWQLYKTFVTPDVAHIEQGRRYRDAALYQQAVDEFSQHISKHPKEILGYIERAQTYELMKDTTFAAEDYRSILELEPNNPANIAQYAGSLMRADDYQKAAEAFEVALDKVPEADRAKVLDQLLTCYIKTGALPKAVEVAGKLYDAQPTLEILQIKGELQMDQNLFREGRETLRKVKDEGGKDPSVDYRLYRSYLIEGDMAGALSVIDSAMLSSPDEVDLFFMKAKITYRKGDMKTALDLIEQGLAKDQAHWRGYAELALIWLREWKKTGEQDLADRVLKAFEVSKDKARIDGRLSFFEGLALAELGEANRGDLKFEEAVRHLGDEEVDDLGFSFLAMAQLMRKDYGSAEAALLRRLQLDPMNIAHWVLLGYVRQESGAAESAGQAFLKSFEVQPDEKKRLLPVESMLRDKNDLRDHMRLAALKLGKEDTDRLQKYLDKSD